MILRIILCILFFFVLSFIITIAKDYYSTDIIIKFLIGMVALALADEVVR